MPTTYAIPNGSTAFAATLYTGNGSTQTVNNSGGFYPDLNWIKSRNNSGQHVLVNSVVGGDRQLNSSNTNAEQNNTALTSAISASGIALGNNSSGTGSTNQSAYTYVLWQWLAGGGAAVTNTAGSITSQVSANTTAGFSVVTYTGTGANATVGHGLGVAPSMVIVKARTGGVESWYVWQSGLTGGTYWLLLNATNAQANDSTRFTATPTSTVINLGSNSATNGSGYTYVAYCWAAVPGYSAFGSYTGNGSSDGPFVYCGFRPRWVMVKRTDTAGNAWYLEDSSRNTYNPVNLELYADLSNAEATSTDYDFLSNGFKIRASHAGINASGGTYIYACFAENPFKFSNAR